jgi:hypothetical protein
VAGLLLTLGGGGRIVRLAMTGTMMMRSAIAAALGLLTLASGAWTPAALARPITPAEERYWPYAGVVSACADGGALSEIASRFSSSEREYWKTGLEIVGFDRVREIGNRTPGLDYIPRRYCTALATFNDGVTRQVSYWIGENHGFAGYGEAVEWCIAGLDRHYAYAPACKMARP